MAVTVEQARTELRRRAAVQELQRRAKATALMEFPDNLIPEEHREFGDKMRNASNYSLMFDELPEAMFDLEPELNETIYGEGTSSASAWTRTKQNVEEASLWQSTMKTWQRGAESVSIDFVWHAAATGKISEAEARKITKQFEARVKADPIKAKNWLENVYLKTVGIVPGMFGGYLEGAKYGVIGAGLGAGFAAGAGQVPPLTVLPEEAVTVPAGVLTGLEIGQAVGQIKFWSEQGYGAIYRQARMENVSKKTASIAASIGGPIYAAIEYSQVDKIIPGLAKLKSGLLKLSLRLAKNVAQEVAEEGAQRVVTDGAVLLSQIAEDEVKLADVPEEVKAIGQNAIDEMKEVVGPMVLLQVLSWRPARNRVSKY
ncbi:MAG: hypothetical protein ACYS6W_18285 [Planctomycetota bacterium]|jgi:hypothetical protein